MEEVIEPASPLLKLENDFTSTTPLLVFVNKKSGGQQGKKVLSTLQSLEINENVFDITRGPAEGLVKCSKAYPSFRVLVFGGDGSAGWVLGEIERLELEERTCLGLFPLGTGNDLARVFGFGGGGSPGNRAKVKTVLDRLNYGSVVLYLDRWLVNIRSDPFLQPENKIVPQRHPDVFNNYFSIGVDAKVALQFHLARENYPNRFTSQFKNQCYYAWLGFKAFFKGCKNLSKKIEIEADGCHVPVPKSAQAVIVVNVPSYAGGTNMWKKPGKRDTARGLHPQAIDDGLFEVVAFKTTVHMGLIRINLRKPIRLVQASTLNIRFSTLEPLPCQIDGEPWLQEKATITITQKGRIKMLKLLSNKEKKAAFVV
eukprot:GCRY01003120.1.p1 GENE.GCRY01003120.1~~GCRY01003120.1.p1  ORF type:complete len:369 (+),score=74.65 GCRY01003120.1:214-1320(+)